MLESPRSAKPATILLVEDDCDLRQVVKITVEEPHLRILEAGDGPSALDLARREKPDLIVLDWVLPGLTGIEIAQALRNEPATARTPIIMLTSRDQPEFIEAAKQIGVSAYLFKPFSPVELVQTIYSVL